MMRAAARALTPAVVAAMALLAPATSRAATYIVNVGNAMDLGSVVAAAAGITTFRINAATGAVTLLSGGGRRLSAGPARALVTVSCQPSRNPNDLQCTQDNVSIQVGSVGAVIGRAKEMEAFTVSMGTATLLGGVTGSGPASFQIGPIGANQSKTFFIGADFPVFGDDSGKPSGAGENGFYAFVLNAQGAQIAGDSDKGRVRALRALAASKISDLDFGRIARPTSGAGAVSVDAATGARNVTGGVGFPTPAPARAAFLVTGEGGQTFSASVPASFQLTGPGTITVTTTNTLPPAPALSGALGAAGTFSFGVGGSFPLSGATATGVYSGVLTVNIDYN